jgi:ectoine hydroxylase-related dioxygenase (phytanoyl-CoA dioxygenase family)
VTAAAPRRPVTEAEVEAFDRDGVVCLRKIVASDWLTPMEAAVEVALGSAATADLSAMGDALGASGAPLVRDAAVAGRGGPRGTFRAGTDHWREQSEFRRFACDSPLGAIVAVLLGSRTVRLYEDSVLVKEPGTAERTAFHQDSAYFHVEGDQVCTVWVPLDPVDAENGAVQYVRGSHRASTRFRPNFFVTPMSLPGTVGEAVPDFSGSRDLVSFDTEPGDVVVHHARTIHGAHANASPTRRRRAVSVRYAGDDTVFRVKTGAPEKAHHAGLVEGRPLDADAFPLAWP